MAPAEVPAAVLPGTPATLSIPPEELIRKAQQLHKDGSGVRQPELLADDFRFEFPIVSLSKKVWQPVPQATLPISLCSSTDVCLPLSHCTTTKTACYLVRFVQVC